VVAGDHSARSLQADALRAHAVGALSQRPSEERRRGSGRRRGRDGRLRRRRGQLGAARLPARPSPPRSAPTTAPARTPRLGPSSPLSAALAPSSERDLRRTQGRADTRPHLLISPTPCAAPVRACACAGSAISLALAPGRLRFGATLADHHSGVTARAAGARQLPVGHRRYTTRVAQDHEGDPRKQNPSNHEHHDQHRARGRARAAAGRARFAGRFGRGGCSRRFLPAFGQFAEGAAASTGAGRDRRWRARAARQQREDGAQAPHARYDAPIQACAHAAENTV
jgi:hypothetical protein